MEEDELVVAPKGNEPEEKVPDSPADGNGNPNHKTAFQLKTVAIPASIALVVGAAIGVAACYGIMNSQLKDSTNRVATLKSAVGTYSESTNKLQSKLESCQDTLGELDDAQSEIDDLKSQISSKQAELNALNGQIDQAKGTPIQLPAGDYKVGTDVPAGRYIISGSSNFITHGIDGYTKINTILGNSSVGRGDYHGNLDIGDSIENHAPATLTPVQ